MARNPFHYGTPVEGDQFVGREEEVDAILRNQLAKSASGDDSGPDAAALIAAVHRLDNLIHHRRIVLAARG